MDATQLVPVPGPSATDAELLAWSWLDELRAQDRSIPWLARHSDRSQGTVYKYAWGKLDAPIEWLKSVAALLARGAS